MNYSLTSVHCLLWWFCFYSFFPNVDANCFLNNCALLIGIMYSFLFSRGNNQCFYYSSLYNIVFCFSCYSSTLASSWYKLFSVCTCSYWYSQNYCSSKLGCFLIFLCLKHSLHFLIWSIFWKSLWMFLNNSFACSNFWIFSSSAWNTFFSQTARYNEAWPSCVLCLCIPNPSK